MNENAGQGPQQQPFSRAGCMTAVFHVLFKIAAAVYFLVSNFFGDVFTVHFTIILVLLVLDFWTVKNVTGRKMVGMRWWNDVTEDGEGWRFESILEGQRDISKREKFWFWGPLVAAPAVWLLFAFLELIRAQFPWILVCVLAIGLSLTNLWGYFKCSRDAKKMVAHYAQTATQHAIHSSIQSAINNV